MLRMNTAVYTASPVTYTRDASQPSDGQKVDEDYVDSQRAHHYEGDHRSDNEEWKQVRAQAEEHPAKHLYESPVRLREVASAKSEERMLGHCLRQILRKVACEKKARDNNSELIKKGRALQMVHDVVASSDHGVCGVAVRLVLCILVRREVGVRGECVRAILAVLVACAAVFPMVAVHMRLAWL